MGAYHARVVMDYVDAFGFSFDTPGWVCDIAAAAWQVGLADEARRLLGHAVAGAERAEVASVLRGAVREVCDCFELKRAAATKICDEFCSSLGF